MTSATAASTPRATIARRLLWQAALSALFLLAAIRTVDGGSLREALAAAELWWAAPALLLFTTAKFIDSWRWRFLLRGTARLPQRALFGAFLAGNMVNNLLPLRAGDVAKVQVLGLRYGTSRAALAASIFIVEATLDGVVFVIFLLVALAFFNLGGLPAGGIAALAGAAALAFSAAVALSRSPRTAERALRWTPARWRSTLRAG
ncbi:MAG: lysylphosphatidylglycerol synthase domain-containing protein, partial [Dehalococcoidia bacterium]|nr:lysylphosphatidylglycerol synthase domain-containing protein [Dehalococcoidia bacterium]